MEGEEQMKVSSWNIVNRLFLSLIVLSALFSPLILLGFNSVFGLGVLLLWMGLVSIKYKTFSIRSVLSLLTWMGLMVIPIVMGYSFVLNRYLVLSILILSTWICELLYKENAWKDVKMVFLYIAPFVFYVYIKTFLALLKNAYSSRLIKSSGEYTVRARMQGVGGYEFIYFLAFLAGIMMGLVLTLKKKRHKVICLIICGMAYVEVVVSNYFTALLLATLMIGLAVIIKLMILKKEWMIFFIMASLVVLLFGNVLVEAFIDIVLEYIPQGGKTYQRLVDMQEAPLKSLFEEFSSGRSEVMIRSIESIKANPFMGRLGIEGLSREELLSKVGQHSFFLDTFCFYGIGIGILVLVNFLSIFRKRFFIREKSIITIPLMISFLLLFFLNNATPSLGIILGLVYPYAMNLVERESLCR